MDKNPHIAQAIANAGGPVATARKTGANNYQTVQQWEKSGNVPAEYAPALESASGVSKRLLCKQWAKVWPELADEATPA
ncbi:carph-isopro domain-containing protein [Achromobacter animicus]|uniref:carph-isopro domain-containing protein n=1 Tax=Achromobacter animicus TaxID=1389935 RepID=UPI0028B04037|nr:YdaS family helix-turn-helix protein [Achromobacter animicus]